MPVVVLNGFPLTFSFSILDTMDYNAPLPLNMASQTSRHHLQNNVDYVSTDFDHDIVRNQYVWYTPQTMCVCIGCCRAVGDGAQHCNRTSKPCAEFMAIKRIVGAYQQKSYPLPNLQVCSAMMWDGTVKYQDIIAQEKDWDPQDTFKNPQKYGWTVNEEVQKQIFHELYNKWKKDNFFGLSTSNSKGHPRHCFAVGYEGDADDKRRRWISIPNFQESALARTSTFRLYSKNLQEEVSEFTKKVIDTNVRCRNIVTMDTHNQVVTELEETKTKLKKSDDENASLKEGSQRVQEENQRLREIIEKYKKERKKRDAEEIDAEEFPSNSPPKKSKTSEITVTQESQNT